jgi:hypothetical protein
LTFTSKLTERVVAKQVKEHTAINELDAKFQSAYRENHSTETALLKVQSDMLSAMDKNKICILVLLDLSAAFDTVNHTYLLDRLKSNFGLSGTVVEWFSSYLSGRTQSVLIDGVSSVAKDLKCGVPQGSVLGPWAFTCYTSPLEHIISKFNVSHHLYADDTQLYSFCSISELSSALSTMENCIQEICNWMAGNHLKMNEEKTGFMILGSKHNLSKLTNIKLNIGGHSVYPSESARNIGVIFNSTMSMEHHVISVCKSANFHLRNISKIRHLLDEKTAEQLVHSFISNKIDYCNALLYGVSDHLLDKIQKIQNNAARIVKKIKKYDHITPALEQLHWLPIKQRIIFKILLITYKAYHNSTPTYLRELLILKEKTRTLRSSNRLLLLTPRTKLKYGDRAFCNAAPSLWNDLPLYIKNSGSITTFKTNLKTYLFNSAFH